MNFLNRLFGIDKRNKALSLIKKEGVHVTHRFVDSFQVELYVVKTPIGSPEYYEVWKKIGLGEIYWVEKQQEEYVVQYYPFPMPR